MKRYLTWIVAAELLFATGNLHANEVEVEVSRIVNRPYRLFDRT
ncbi:assembly/transport component in curli production [Salmonella enterica subsp. enterica]|uniref:Assembly/transport component in curli production n=1 Tax=Salmonella enterica I TaxID=59201 RepID=A0A447U555_SALET|nr:assembly/transport component in curli production [Salmonella enterica subsp. enterica]